MKTICCRCHVLICDGPTIDGHCSHGLCPTCAAAIFRESLPGLTDGQLDAFYQQALDGWVDASLSIASAETSEQADKAAKTYRIRQAEVEAILNDARRRATAGHDKP